MDTTPTPVSPAFVHLRMHTEFSVTDGILRVGDAVRRAVDDQMPALAISDLSNLFGLIKFYRATRGKGIKPVAAVDAWFHNDAQPDQPFRSLLIVRNHAGYLQLCELLSRAFLQNQIRGRACIRWAWLEEVGCDGLIALSGFAGGEIGALLQAGQGAKAEWVAQRWVKQFKGHFYLEIQRRGLQAEEALVESTCLLAARLQIPVVATHPIQFLNPDDFRAHEARVCIAQGEVLSNQRRPRLFTEQQYFKTTAQMQELFADIPSALANTVRIADACNLTLELGKPKLPLFPTPAGISLDDYMVQLSYEGLDKRLRHLFPQEAERERRRPEYEARLKIETDTIVNMGFSGYFLIVQDFINWGKNNGVPVGPGRGSGAGSIAAYALGITDLDPIRYDLLFERFLNPERVSMPDFDIDFCQDNRDRVIDYVKQAYGRDAVSQIATFGTLGAKAVIRDAGRVLDMPYNYCDGLSKLIPHVPTDPWDLKRAIEEEPAFKERVENEEEAQAIIKLAQPLEGLTRNIGMHAGGVLIAPGKLTDFCPLYCADGSENSVVSQFDKDDVEAVGLVKFDFLGLRNLTILDWAVRWVREGYEDMRNFRLEDLSLDDPAVYRLFSDGNTTAVFQSESRSAKDLEKKLRPDNFEDIIALMALNRPGPLGSGMVDDFIARKKEQTKTGQGRAEWYFHEKLANTLKSTYGVIVYQEQVMLVAQLLAGYSLGGADLLRRAMGKKKPEEMAKQREIFTSGATERGVAPQLATQLFDLMEKFAEYGFNKCVHGSTCIMDADTGKWLTVHDLLRNKQRPRLHALDEHNNLVPRRVLDVVWNGVKPVFRLTTRSGHEIMATGNHPFRTVDGWVNLEDLQVGQPIAAAAHLRVRAREVWSDQQVIALADAGAHRIPPAVFELSDENIALFLGHLCCGDDDGAWAESSAQIFATASKDMAGDIRCLLMRLGIASVLHHKGIRQGDQISPGYAVQPQGADSALRFVEQVLPHALGRTEQRAAVNDRRAKEWVCHASPPMQPADIVWDEVVAIDPVGLDDTYDLEIEQHHNFVAEGLVVHNSHSAAYALVAYHTAWLKAHYPAEFMAATLSSDMDDTDKVKIFVDDSITQCKLQVLPPDINESGFRFLPKRKPDEARARVIRYGLGAVKGTGQAACEAIVAERERNGPYNSVFDLVRRVDRRQINRRVIEGLARAGAFDALHADRASVLASVGRAMEWADVQDANASQCSLFDADEGGAAPPALLSVPPWNDRQKLSEEKTALGFYLTGHLFDADAPKVRPFIKTQLAKLAPSRDLVWMTGVCAALRTQITKRGKMAFLTLDDASGAVEISVFNELFEQSRSWLKEDVLVVVQGKVSDDAYSGGLRVVADRICTLAEARAEFVHGLRLAINGRADAAKLDALLKPHVAADKSCLVEIDYQNDAASCTLRLSDQWRVRPDDALMEKLQAWLGEGRVSWIY